VLIIGGLVRFFGIFIIRCLNEFFVGDVLVLNRKFVLLFALLLFCSCVFSFDANLYSSGIQSEKDRIFVFGERISEMKESGFAVSRMVDELSVLRQTSENNVYKVDNNLVPDFDVFNFRADGLDKILIVAQQVKDELVALKRSIDGLEGKVDLVPLREMFLEAEKEFSDERYEYATARIDATYAKMSELQGVEAKASAAYEATRKSVLGFVSDNWGFIVLVVVGPGFVYLLFRKRIKLWGLNRRIEGARFEEGVLKNEVKKAQENYFIEGRIAEGEYSIKVKMYGEKIRDLNRLAAVYEEKKAELLHGKTEKVENKKEKINKK